MEEIKKFEEFVDNELVRLEERTLLFKNFKLMLNSETIKTGLGTQIESLKNEGFKTLRKASSAPSAYPKKCWADKARFILENYSRATEVEEFKSKFEEYEGDKASKNWDKFLRALRQLTHPRDGEFLYFEYKSSKQRFYIKHEWLDENKNVTESFLPPKEIIQFPLEATFENMVWHKSK
ncbi:MAG: hypothetical protein Q8L81_08980 [Bacteroidota bacterium]|nr:hypothetical protein [Bacteroidota bacterium]